MKYIDTSDCARNCNKVIGVCKFKSLRFVKHDKTDGLVSTSYFGSNI